MTTLRWVICFGLTLLVAGSALAAKQNAKPAEATIINTGSTNTSGYQVFVQPSGRVRYAVTHRYFTRQILIQHSHIPKAQATKLFHGLAAAVPLEKLPVTHTFKSASFGTSTYIQYKGQRTPDLNCPADARERALQADVTQIVATLHLKNAPRGSFGSPVELMPALKH